MDNRTRQAISDALHFMSGLELRALFRSGTLGRAASDDMLCGFPVEVSHITLSPRDPVPGQGAAATDVQARAVAALAEGLTERFFLDDDTLCILLAAPGPSAAAQTHEAGAALVHLPPEALAHFLAASYPDKRITPAQQRLLTSLLSGLSLIDAARRDMRSI